MKSEHNHAYYDDRKLNENRSGLIYKERHQLSQLVGAGIAQWITLWLSNLEVVGSDPVAGIGFSQGFFPSASTTGLSRCQYNGPGGMICRLLCSSRCASTLKSRP